MVVGGKGLGIRIYKFFISSGKKKETNNNNNNHSSSFSSLFSFIEGGDNNYNWKLIKMNLPTEKKEKTPEEKIPGVKPFHRPSPPIFSSMSEYTDSCVARTVFSGVAGGVMGLVFGGIFGISPATVDDRNKPWKTQLGDGFRSLRTQSWSYAKNFAYVGFIYSGVECFIEWGRGKTDIKNSAYAGCTTGGLLAYRAGPKAALFGCTGFAAFSLGIDYFTGRHETSHKKIHDDVDS